MSTHIVFRRRRAVSTPYPLYYDIPSALTGIRRRRRAAILKYYVAAGFFFFARIAYNYLTVLQLFLLMPRDV